MQDASSTGKDGVRAIDLDAGLERLMGDRAMYLRVLVRFQADYRDSAQRLRSAIDEDNPALAQRIVHTLKGASAMIEARRLRQLSLDIELGLRAQGSVAPGMVDAAEAELGRVLAELDRTLPIPDKVVASAELADATDATGTVDLARLRVMLDMGDGDAPALIDAQRPVLLATLGAERLRALDGAVHVFDFERALAVLDGIVHA